MSETPAPKPDIEDLSKDPEGVMAQLEALNKLVEQGLEKVTVNGD